MTNRVTHAAAFNFNWMLTQSGTSSDREFATLWGVAQGRKTGGGFGRTTPRLRQLQQALPSTYPRLSAQAHAQHERGGGHSSHVIVRAGRG